jgi:peptide/nickel transport system ATP-binding protein
MVPGSVLVVRGLAVEAVVGADAVPMLRGLNFALAPGRVLGLVGESGAGKSMVGHAIAQVMPKGFRVSHGAVEFGGVDLVAMEAADRRALLGREIGFIPQDARAALHPLRTVGGLLDEHHRRLGVRGRALREYALAALAAVGIADPGAALGLLADRLSPEDCQRVLVAMAFAGRPRLVVADEPTAGLDVAAQARILALIDALRRAHGAALLFITHDLHLAAGLCDDVAVMYGGDIVELGPAAALRSRPLHPYTRCLQLATPSMAGPRRALYALPAEMPGLRGLARLSGCRFAPRCPVKAEYCLRSEPPLAGDQHLSACLRPGLVPAIRVEGALAAPPWRAAGQVPVLEMACVSKAFATGPWWRRGRVEAVRGVNLSIAPGEFVAVVGEAGSGKSTLARLVAGLEMPDGGRIALGGQDVTMEGDAAHRQRIATVHMVFPDSDAALNPGRRVSDSITQALEAGRARSGQRERRARALLAEMGMALELGVRLPGQLSPGERRRVGLARALCGKPRLLVADGLLAGLDVTVQAQLLALLHRLRQDHDFALLFVSHDLPVVRHLCDRVVVMQAGRIVEDGPAETVLGWPLHEATRRLVAAVPA